MNRAGISPPGVFGVDSVEMLAARLFYAKAEIRIVGNPPLPRRVVPPVRGDAMDVLFILQESPSGLLQAATAAEPSSQWHVIIGGVATFIGAAFAVAARLPASLDSADALVRAMPVVDLVGLCSGPITAAYGALLGAAQRAPRPATVLATLGKTMY